jgi:hypothetical protein
MTLWLSESEAAVNSPELASPKRCKNVSYFGQLTYHLATASFFQPVTDSLNGVGFLAPL